MNVRRYTIVSDDPAAVMESDENGAFVHIDAFRNLQEFCELHGIKVIDADSGIFDVEGWPTDPQH